VRAVVRVLSQPSQGRGGGARRMGAQRAPAHLPHPARLGAARPADHLAAATARARARAGRPLEMADQAAHPHGASPADGDVGALPVARTRALMVRDASFPNLGGEAAAATLLTMRAPGG